jgi:hypothetical protein
MVYAIFNDNEKMSHSFPTEEEAIKKADEAGLVETNNDKQALEDDLISKPCPPDTDTKSDEELDWAMNQERPADEHSSEYCIPKIKGLRLVIEIRELLLLRFYQG